MNNTNLMRELGTFGGGDIALSSNLGDKKCLCCQTRNRKGRATKARGKVIRALRRAGGKAAIQEGIGDMDA